MILPQLGRQELYDKIRLDEPWDSEHNKQFHEIDVPFYQCPTLVKHSSAAFGPGKTNYIVITGDNMPFDTTGHGKKLSDVSTASNKTILVTEQTITACWMSPAFDLSLEDVIAGIGQKTLADIKRIRSRHLSDGVNAGLMNGSVFSIREIDLSSYVKADE